MKNSSEATVHGNDNHFSDGTERDDGNHVHGIELTPHHTYIDTSKFQRIILSIGSSIAALVNPHRLTSIYLNLLQLMFAIRVGCVGCC